jgi:chemotaxis signal transduction protein
MVLAILFSVSNSSYALPCQSVVEVVPLLELRTALQAPPWLAGTFAYHGALVSVVDVCQMLAGYSCSRRLSSRIALVRCSLPELGEVILGVLAERMTAVRRLDGESLYSNETGGPSYLGRVVKQGAELVQLIDVEAFVRASRAHFSDVPRLEAGAGP